MKSGWGSLRQFGTAVAADTREILTERGSISTADADPDPASGSEDPSLTPPTPMMTPSFENEK